MKKFVIGAVSSIAFVGLMSGSALAWTFDMSGTGKCLPNGTYQLTWTVDNRTENEDMTIEDSSNPAVIPVGSVIPAKSIKQYNQVVNGSQVAEYDLRVVGSWPSDVNTQQRSANSSLETACEQPVVGGLGGGSSSTVATVSATSAQPTTPQTVATTPQVQVPTGAVDAGSSGGTVAASIVSGLVGSVILIGSAVRRLIQS